MKALINSLPKKAKSLSFAIIVGSILVLVQSIFAVPVQLLSVRNPSVALPVGGNDARLRLV